MPHVKAIVPEFAAKTRNETGNLFYEFRINGDEVFDVKYVTRKQLERLEKERGMLGAARRRRNGGEKK